MLRKWLISPLLQCHLFSRCQTLEDVPGSVRSVTGLLPAVQRREGDSQSPRAARLVDEVRRMSERREGWPEKLGAVRPGRRCGREKLMARSCKFQAESVIRLISSRSLADCEAACRAESGCSSLTFHPQGGAGVSLASPCLLVRECRETVWCRDCLSLTLTNCQAEPLTARPLLTVKEEEDSSRPHSAALLVAGGHSGDSVRQVELVSSQGGRCYRELREMPEPRSRAVAGAVGGGKVVVCGGSSARERYSSSCDQLDLRTGDWSRSGERMVRGREDAGLSELEEGRLVVTGGWDGRALLDSVELWSSQYGAWQEVRGWRLTRARYQHCATSLGNTVIIAGGYPTLRLVQVLSLEGGDWQGWRQLQSMREGRVAHGCAVASISGSPRLIISGGQNGGEFLSSVESLALAGSQAGTWSSLASLPLPRRHHMMTSLAGGSLLVVGGDTASFSPQRANTFTLPSQLLRLDLEEDRGGWNNTGHLLSPRTLMAAAVVDQKFCTENLF